MRASLIVAVASAALFCVACSDSTGGQATGTQMPPASTSPTQSVPTTSADPVSPMQGKKEFSSDELCDLLTSDEVQQLGGGTDEGKATMNVEERAPLCQWVYANSLNVVYNPNSVVEQLKSGPGIKKTRLKVVGLDALMSDTDAEGGLCQVGFNLTDHSELVVAVGVLTRGEGKYDRCTVAKQMANIIFAKVK